MNASTRLIMQILADEREVIPYRVPIAKAVGSITSTIFLQQVQYWWVRQGFQPFYKFRAPCSHSFYKEGDSWCEELGFTTGGFDTARRHVAIRKTAGMTMAEARVLTRKGNIIKPVIYWTNSGRLTYYTIHTPAFEKLLVQVYLNTESEDSKIRNPELANSGNQSYLNTEFGITISEITKDHQETTTEDSAAKTAPPPAKPKKPKVSQHPAVQAYRSETNLYPPKPWHQVIANAVGDSPSEVERWRQVVIAYQGMGWNKRNVKTMLEEYFLEDRMPGEDNGRNGGGKDHYSPEGQAAQAQRLAERGFFLDEE